MRDRSATCRQAASGFSGRARGAPELRGVGAREGGQMRRSARSGIAFPPPGRAGGSARHRAAACARGRPSAGSGPHSRGPFLPSSAHRRPAPPPRPTCPVRLPRRVSLPERQAARAGKDLSWSGTRLLQGRQGESKAASDLNKLMHTYASRLLSLAASYRPGPRSLPPLPTRLAPFRFQGPHPGSPFPQQRASSHLAASPAAGPAADTHCCTRFPPPGPAAQALGDARLRRTEALSLAMGGWRPPTGPTSCRRNSTS